MTIVRRSTGNGAMVLGVVTAAVAKAWCCCLLLCLTANKILFLGCVVVDAATATETTTEPAMNETRTPTTTTTTTTRPPLLADGTASPFLLGVMADAGRHEFSTEWLRSFMNDIHRMGFNALHLTLTNDQRFAFRVAKDSNDDDEENGNEIETTGKSKPNHSNNNIESLFAYRDLKILAKHARSLDNMTILPEVSLPFSAASWGGINIDYNDSVDAEENDSERNNPPSPLSGSLLPPNCPRYTCSPGRAMAAIGTNLPLNIAHPQLPNSIRRVLKHLVSALDEPAYLHLGVGGSSSSSSSSSWNQNNHNYNHDCWKEATAKTNSDNDYEKKKNQQRRLVDDYDGFEKALEGILSNDLGYRPQVIRSFGDAGIDNTKDDSDIIHGHRQQPGGAAAKNTTTLVVQYQDHRRSLVQGLKSSNAPSPSIRPYLLQPRELNMATTLIKDHPTGWEVYQQTLEILIIHERNLLLGGRGGESASSASYASTSSASASASAPLFRGMIISTEAMPPTWFERRNVLGRLLAISMAVGDFSNANANYTTTKNNRHDENVDAKQYQQHREQQEQQEKESNVKQHAKYYYTDPIEFERAYLALCNRLFPKKDDINSKSPSSTSNFCDRLGGLRIKIASSSSQPSSSDSSIHGVGKIASSSSNSKEAKNLRLFLEQKQQQKQQQQNSAVDAKYKSDYSALWKDWADETCHRLTESKEELKLQAPANPSVISIQNKAFAAYWQDDDDDDNDLLSHRETATKNNINNTTSLLLGSMLLEEPLIFGLDDDARKGSGEKRSHAKHDGTSIRDSVQSQKPTLIHEIFGTMQVPFRGVIVDLVDNITISSKVLQDLMERIMVPLGLNTLQLSLMNRFGCSLRLESLEELYHLVPKPPRNIEPFTDGILGQIVITADRLGIELIPEISITTQATGWYHAGFLVNCPNTLCSSSISSTITSDDTIGGGEIANDVNRGSLLPVVLNMIRKLREIFHSGSFLHLGSDERKSSQACWIESGRVRNYDAFERKLSYLSETRNWYNASSILRWENREGVVYPERTGNITHYQYDYNPNPQQQQEHFGALADGEDSSNDDSAASFGFGSLSITPEKDPWSIYQETRKWVGRRPWGLLAKISLKDFVNNSEHHSVDQNYINKMGLLAFALGLSSQAPIMEDAAALNEYISTLCETNDSDLLCTVSSNKEASKSKQQITITPRGPLLCRAMTKSVSRPVMRLTVHTSTSGLVDDSSNIEEQSRQ